MPRYYSSAREKKVLFIIVHGCESKDILLATCIHLLGIRENPQINQEKLKFFIIPGHHYSDILFNLNPIHTSMSNYKYVESK
jgi:hypothetical protein